MLILKMQTKFNIKRVDSSALLMREKTSIINVEEQEKFKSFENEYNDLMKIFKTKKDKHDKQETY